MTDQIDVLRQNVAKQIEEAFADTPYPGDNNIGWGCGSEGKEFEEVVRGKHWKDLTLDFIIKHRSNIHCMTTDGFRFYLPAFLLAIVWHWEEVDTLPIGVFRSLTPPDYVDAERIFQLFPNLNNISSISDDVDEQMYHFIRQIRVFSMAEKSAVKLFLETYPDLFPQEIYLYDRVKRAFEFWYRFEQLK